MGLTVNVRSEGSVTVVVLRGAACDELLGQVADGIEAVAGAEPLVVDLTDVMLSHPTDLSTFLEALSSRCAQLRVVCGRIGGRRVVRQSAFGVGVSMFTSVAEAVAAPSAPALGADGWSADDPHGQPLSTKRTSSWPGSMTSADTRTA